MGADYGVYRGRLSCDGEGNLLAHEATKVGTKIITITDENGGVVLDESGNGIEVEVPIFKIGKNHLRPVAAHEGSYVFVNDGEQSHNDRHHERFALVQSTAQAIANGVDDETVAHDAEPLPDDPHFTKVKRDPNSVAVKITGHTDAYMGGDN